MSYTSYALQVEGSGTKEEWVKALSHALVGGLTGYISQWGQPAHLAKNMGYSMAVSSASGAINSAIDGRSWNAGNSLLMGAASGVLTSQHFDNFMTGHGFRSYDSEIGMMLNRGEYLRAVQYVGEKFDFDVSSIKTVMREKGLNTEATTTHKVGTKEVTLKLGDKLFDSDGKYLGTGAFASNVKHELTHFDQFLGPDAEHFDKAAYILYSKEDATIDEKMEAFKVLEAPAYNAEREFARRLGSPAWVRQNSYDMMGKKTWSFVEKVPISWQAIWLRPRPNPILGALNAIYLY